MDIFTKFKQAIKIREVLVDNNVFQLHYRVTAVLLLCCAGLVASKQHFGDPIDCITRDDIPNKIMDTYCWIHATFTLPDACNKTVGVEVAHPCVDKFSHSGESRIYHKYYQWVYFVLFFQAAFFYAPHFFWKSCESKLLRTLTDDLRDPLFKKEEKADKANDVVLYLERHRFMHRKYYYYFTLFEVANFVNVVAQIYVVDQFLGGFFTTYGMDVIHYAQMEQDERFDPMVRVFPRMTKCTFHRFGSSGDVQTHDALCILPLNIINEKIYIIMWFWFVFLAIVTGFWLVFRALTFVKVELRFRVLKRRANLTNQKMLRFVVANSDAGDWFVLSMMCKNMDSQWFRFVIHNYRAKLPELLKKEKEKREQKLNAGPSSRGRRAGPNNRRDKRPMLQHDEYDEYDLDDLERGSLSTGDSARSNGRASRGTIPALPSVNSGAQSRGPAAADSFDGVTVDPPRQLRNETNA